MEQAIGYLCVDNDDARTRDYCKAQKLQQLHAFLHQIGAEDAAIYVDESPASETPQRPRLTDLLREITDAPTKLFVVTSIFELGDNFLACLSALQILAEHHVRIILMDNNIDTACMHEQAAELLAAK